MALGGIVAPNPRIHPSLQRLVRPLGLHDVGEFQFLYDPDADEDDPDIVDLDAALAEVEAEFELLGA
jgi:hypothetical protein